MNWYQDLYVGNSIEKKVKKTMRKLERNSGQLKLFCVCVSASENDSLDIIPSWEITIFRKHYNDLKIVGLAGSMEEAVELTGRIISDIYESAGRLDIRNYLLENWKS